jgi:hypothetical protein
MEEVISILHSPKRCSKPGGHGDQASIDSISGMDHTLPLPIPEQRPAASSHPRLVVQTPFQKGHAQHAAGFASLTMHLPSS